MTSRLLLTCLVELVREAFADYPFPAPRGEGMQPVQVFLHGLPEGQQEGCYPFVIVRWIEGQVELEPWSRCTTTGTDGSSARAASTSFMRYFCPA